MEVSPEAASNRSASSFESGRLQRNLNVERTYYCQLKVIHCLVAHQWPSSCFLPILALKTGVSGLEWHCHFERWQLGWSCSKLGSKHGSLQCKARSVCRGAICEKTSNLVVFGVESNVMTPVASAWIYLRLALASIELYFATMLQLGNLPTGCWSESFSSIGVSWEIYLVGEQPLERSMSRYSMSADLRILFGCQFHHC